MKLKDGRTFTRQEWSDFIDEKLHEAFVRQLRPLTVSDNAYQNYINRMEQRFTETQELIFGRRRSIECRTLINILRRL